MKKNVPYVPFVSSLCVLPAGKGIEIWITASATSRQLVLGEEICVPWGLGKGYIKGKILPCYYPSLLFRNVKKFLWEAWLHITQFCTSFQSIKISNLWEKCCLETKNSGQWQWVSRLREDKSFVTFLQFDAIWSFCSHPLASRIRDKFLSNCHSPLDRYLHQMRTKIGRRTLFSHVMGFQSALINLDIFNSWSCNNSLQFSVQFIFLKWSSYQIFVLSRKYSYSPPLYWT